MYFQNTARCYSSREDARNRWECNLQNFKILNRNFIELNVFCHRIWLWAAPVFSINKTCKCSFFSVLNIEGTTEVKSASQGRTKEFFRRGRMKFFIQYIYFFKLWNRCVKEIPISEIFPDWAKFCQNYRMNNDRGGFDNPPPLSPFASALFTRLKILFRFHNLNFQLYCPSNIENKG